MDSKDKPPIISIDFSIFAEHQRIAQNLSDLGYSSVIVAKPIPDGEIGYFICIAKSGDALAGAIALTDLGSLTASVEPTAYAAALSDAKRHPGCSTSSRTIQ